MGSRLTRLCDINGSGRFFCCLCITEKNMDIILERAISRRNSTSNEKKEEIAVCESPPVELKSEEI